MTETPETNRTDNPQTASPSLDYPPIDPRLIAAMYSVAQENKIDLLEYWLIIKKRWKIIFYVMSIGAIAAAGASLLLPNVYEAQVLMAPNNSDGSSSGGSGLASTLGGGLASLAGINLGSSSVEQNIAILKTRAFLWGFIKDNKIMPILYAGKWGFASKAWRSSNHKGQPTLWDAYRKFGNLLSVSTNKKSGLVTLTVDWTNPVLAAEWANQLVARLNDYLRMQAISRSNGDIKYLNETLQKTVLTDVRQTLYMLMAQEQKNAMIANAQKQYAFHVLDAAAPPDRKTKPHRGLIVVLATLATGFLAIIFVFMQEGVRRRLQVDGDAARASR